MLDFAWVASKHVTTLTSSKATYQSWPGLSKGT